MRSKTFPPSIFQVGSNPFINEIQEFPTQYFFQFQTASQAKHHLHTQLTVQGPWMMITMWHGLGWKCWNLKLGKQWNLELVRKIRKFALKHGWQYPKINLNNFDDNQGQSIPITKHFRLCFFSQTIVISWPGWSVFTCMIFWYSLVLGFDRGPLVPQNEFDIIRASTKESKNRSVNSVTVQCGSWATKISGSDMVWSTNILVW